MNSRPLVRDRAAEISMRYNNALRRPSTPRRKYNIKGAVWLGRNWLPGTDRRDVGPPSHSLRNKVVYARLDGFGDLGVPGSDIHQVSWTNGNLTDCRVGAGAA